MTKLVSSCCVWTMDALIDTKGWAGWEWTHGVGLYGMYQYYLQTGDETIRDIIDSWFADRFA